MELKSDFEKEKEEHKIPAEQDINILKERIEKIEPDLTTPEKEKRIKEEIKNYIEEIQETPDFASPVDNRDEEEEVSKFPPSQQVGALISLVFEKGLEKTVSVAKNLNNPAILDEFHDTLIDRYYEKLLEEGFLRP